MKQTVEFYQTDNEYINVYAPDQYQFRADRKFHWLQKTALWILKKLKCNAIRQDLLIKRNRIDIDNLFEFILQQQYELYGRYLLESKHLLVGYDQYSKIMEGTLHSPFTFEVPRHNFYQSVPLENEPYGYTTVKTEVSGLKVTLVPWMDGTLVLPKEILK